MISHIPINTNNVYTITLFLLFLIQVIFRKSHGLKYSYLIPIISIQLYGFKYYTS